jgi:diaminopimelate epimerase
MKFTKMEGLGNDYVYVDLFEEALPDIDLSELARNVSDRHFGIGSDGLVLVSPARGAHCRMRMFNSDGSESEMCGNAVRCIAKLMYDKGRHTGGSVTISTLDGVKACRICSHSGRQAIVEVLMGVPLFSAEDIPVKAPGTEAVGMRLDVGGEAVDVTCVSMGNPHCVIVAEELGDSLVHGLGPKIEVHGAFPQRTNVEFVKIIDPRTVSMRVWERGAGETLACGTGASATLAACVRLGLTERAVTMRLLGGDMDISWRDDGQICIKAPATTVFTGEIEI